MELPEEFESLRAEQRRLRDALDRIDERIADLDRHLHATPGKIVEPPTESPSFPAPSPATPPPVPPAQPMLQAPVLAAADGVLAKDMRPPAPSTEPEPSPSDAGTPQESFELRLGRIWLARIGIVILLTGLVFLGNYAWQELIGRIGPAGKLLLIYLAGGTLCGLGAWLARTRDDIRNYARVLLAGGCATIYYATYAAHFVGTLRVIDSPLIGGLLLLALGGGFIALADRVRSQTLASATIALTFYTSAINPVGAFSLFSNLVVSAAAVALLARRRWASVSFLSLVGAYGSFAFWRFHQSETLSVGGEAFWPAVLFPAAYWIVHTVAVMLKRVDSLDPASRPVFLTLNNAALFGLAGPVIAHAHPDWFWICTAVYGATLVALSLVAAKRSPGEPWFDGSFLAQGVALILLALIYKLTGWQQAISFALVAATLVSTSRLRHGAILRFFAGIAAIVSAISVADLFAEQSAQARPVAGAVAVILAGTAVLLKRQSTSRCDWRVLAFALLSAVIGGGACLDEDMRAGAIRILLIALVAIPIARWLRIPEFIHVAQPLALFGQCLLLTHAWVHDVPPASITISASFALANIHLWQWQPAPKGRRLWTALNIPIPAVLALSGIASHLPEAQKGPVCAVVALVLLGYGTLTRARTLQLASGIFTTASLAWAALAIDARVPWSSPAFTAILLVAQSFVLSRISAQTAPAIVLRTAALFLGTAMVFAYAPTQWWFLVFAFAALGFFAIASVRPRNETLFHAGLLFALSGITWTSRLVQSPAQWTDLFGFAAIVLAQQVGRRRLSATGWFPGAIQTVFCVAATAGAWITVHRLVAPSAGGFLITVTWSLLALVVLGGGFALRERIYRILGLVILAAAVGRIFCIDVWQLETLYRILSFLVLGAVLLALGFLYNRFADTLRRIL